MNKTWAEFEIYNTIMRNENEALKEEYVIVLEQKNEELKERIKKAIEYIKDNVAVYAFGNEELPHWEFDDNNIQDLLKILKGED